MGDGGSFMDRVITPIFMVITFEASPCLKYVLDNSLGAVGVNLT